MKIKKIIPISFCNRLVVFLITTAVSLQSIAQSLNEIEKLVVDSVTYRYGKNRQNLNTIEEIVRKTQSPDKRREIEKIFARYLTNEQATVEFKEFICRQLWYLGTTESVASVATLLTNEDTIGWGCYALVRNPSKEATQALIKAIDVVSQKQKPKIIAALGQKRDPMATAIVSRYCTDTNQEIASAAITALGQIASKDSIQILLKLAGSQNKDTADQAAHSLILAAEHLSKSGSQKEALDIYKQIYPADYSPSVKVAALRGIVLCSKDSGVDYILQNLKSDDYKTQVAAVGTINLITNQQSLVLIAKSVPELPPTAQALVISILADKKEKNILPIVKSLIKSPDKQVRLESLKAMGKIGDSSCIMELVNAMASNDPQEKSVAKASLSTMDYKGTDKEIINLLSKAESKIQIDLIDVIVERSATDSVPQLIRICERADANVQKAALRAIGKLGEPNVLSDLLKLTLSLKDNNARTEGETAIVSIANKIQAKNNRSSLVVKSWSTAKDDTAKETIIRIAGGIGDKTALDFLSKIVSTEQGNIQDLAVRELANWEDPDALQILEKIFKNTQNPTHRALTFRTYARLLKSASNLSPNDLYNRYSDALQIAQSPEEKKLVMSGLAGVPTTEALNFSLKMLNDETIKNEAAQAAMSICASIFGSDPNAAKNALNTVIKSDIADDLRQQANMLLKQIEEMGAYILKWQLAGPYAADGKNYDALFDVQFPPEQGKPDVKWVTPTLPNDPKRPYLVDLLKIFGGEQRVAYARCYVYSPVQQKVRLEMGSDDGMKVWLNGKLVYSLNVARPITPNSDKTEIVLNQGWNTLLFKITQNNLGWEFCARIVTLDGKIVDGIKYATTRE